ncbi:MAG: hypothetical protein L6300_00990, partial [Syntrophaceae bacterium]|nr:hypothetical protein [Syntrophaceae bacterium]
GVQVSGRCGGLGQGTRSGALRYFNLLIDLLKLERNIGAPKRPLDEITPRAIFDGDEQQPFVDGDIEQKLRSCLLVDQQLLVLDGYKRDAHPGVLLPPGPGVVLDFDNLLSEFTGQDQLEQGSQRVVRSLLMEG